MSKRKLKRLILLFAFVSFFLIFDFYYQRSGAEDYLKKVIKKDFLTITPLITSSEKDNHDYYVLKIIDGDTIEIKANGKKEKVRLIGVNTPEINDKRPVVACMGKLAKERLKKKLEGKIVRLENDSSQGDRDKYNRLLRYIFLKDKTNINLWLIKEGYAYEYTYHFPYRYQKEFQEAQKKAEKEKKGLWSEEIGC